MTAVTTCVLVCVLYDSVMVKVVYTMKSVYPPEGGEYLFRGAEHTATLLLLLSISKWVTQKARSLHKVVPSRYTHTITTKNIYNTHTQYTIHMYIHIVDLMMVTIRYSSSFQCHTNSSD